jgi:hypothetical protein
MSDCGHPNRNIYSSIIISTPAPTNKYSPLYAIFLFFHFCVVVLLCTLFIFR